MKKSIIKDEFEDLKKALDLVEESEYAISDTQPDRRNSLIEDRKDEPPKQITKELSYLKFMTYNKAKMQAYYEVSMMHANTSFIFALAASFIGIVFFVIATLMVISGNADSSAVIIPAAGSAITGIIAGTIFVVYNKSMKLMNHFFDSLENTDKFLTIVSLVNNVNKDKQDEMYCAIITSQLESAGSKETKVNSDEK